MFERFDFYTDCKVLMRLFDCAWDKLQEKYPNHKLIASDAFCITVCDPSCDVEGGGCFNYFTGYNGTDYYAYCYEKNDGILLEIA